MSIVIRASNPTAKLAAAEDYLVRYPHSSNRIKIAEMVAAEIEKVPDGSAALTLIDSATTVFKNEPERNVLVATIAIQTPATLHLNWKSGG